MDRFNEILYFLQLLFSVPCLLLTPMDCQGESRAACTLRSNFKVCSVLCAAELPIRWIYQHSDNTGIKSRL